MNIKVTTFFSVLLLANVVSAQTNAAPDTPMFGPDYFSKKAPRITLQTDQTQYSGSKDIILNITIENTDTKPFVFYLNKIELLFKWKVSDAAGREIPMIPGAMRSYKGFEGWDIAPGKQRKGYVYLNRMFNLSSVDKYSVSITRIQDRLDKIDVTTKPATFEVLSNPVLGGWE